MKQTISILVENRAGVLNRVASLFSRRAFNIDSLAVGMSTVGRGICKKTENQGI